MGREDPLGPCGVTGVERTVEGVARRMDALGIWRKMEPYCWAIRPAGTALPYFCAVIAGDGRPVRVRFLLLEGWQTFHDYHRFRVDRFFGYYLSPMEMPHLELVVLDAGEAKLFRHDPGYLPREANERERALGVRLLWEAYGVMLRLEADGRLPLRYADEQALFSRRESASGVWTDEPLAIPPPPPFVERIELDRDDIRRAKDVPFAADRAVDLDLRLLPTLMTRDARPRSVYELIGVDSATGEEFIRKRASVRPDGGLKGLWTGLPAAVLKSFAERGTVPGELRLLSPRVFRLLRPVCLELPIRLSLHDRLPSLPEA